MPSVQFTYERLTHRFKEKTQTFNSQISWAYYFGTILAIFITVEDYQFLRERNSTHFYKPKNVPKRTQFILFFINRKLYSVHSDISVGPQMNNEYRLFRVLLFQNSRK